MNSENSKTSNPHRLLLSLTDKIDLESVKTEKKVLRYQILVSAIRGKIQK